MSQHHSAWPVSRPSGGGRNPHPSPGFVTLQRMDCALYGQSWSEVEVGVWALRRVARRASEAVRPVAAGP